MNWVLQAVAGTEQALQSPQLVRFRRLTVENHGPNDVYISRGFRTSEAGADWLVPARTGRSIPMDSTAAVTVLVDPRGAAKPSTASRVEVSLDECEGTTGASWALAESLDYVDSHSGQYAAAGASTAIALDTRSGQLQIWNRDATNDLYVNLGAPTTGGGTDMLLKPGESWHGAVATRTVYYQGGAMQLAAWA